MSAVRDGRRGHFWMHDAILDNYAADLGVYGLAVYAMLCRRANKEGVSHPSIRRLADDLGISERQAKRELKKLRDLGLISIEQRSEQNKTSLYTILEVPERPRVSQSPGDSESPDPVSVSHPKEYTREGSVEANASSGKPQKPVALEKHIVDEIYRAMREADRRLPNAQFEFHLGRAQDMLAKDNPTQPELDALPEWFLRHWKIKGWADAPAALMEMRRQQDRDELLAAREQATGGAMMHEKNDKPMNPTWYESVYGASALDVKRWAADGMGHAAIERLCKEGA